ncbi:MAG: stage 0 sporulation protein, partial [Clostridia bacterium]|nr:stage 0 sporulation protein [Clostridia bacterium]
MTEVIGVRFKKVGKVYYFDPHGIQVEKDMCVVVETARGMEYGEVAMANAQVEDEKIVQPLKRMIRIATDADKKIAEENARFEQEAFRICEEKIAKHQLEMKLVTVEYTFDHSKLLFYFSADGRVDFRELVKDLAGVFRTRIELR